MLVLNLPFKALMFLTLMRPSLVLFLVLWLKLVKDFLKVRCRLALLPFLISCLIWLDLVASLPLIKERIRSEERFSRNAETDLVCRLLLEKKKHSTGYRCLLRGACVQCVQWALYYYIFCTRVV